MRARTGSDPSSSACGPRSHKNPSIRAPAMRPPGSATSSTSTASWPLATSRCAAVSPEMPPPMTAIRTLDPPPRPGGALCQIGQRGDKRRVGADGAGAGEVGDAGLLGALAVEDVDLLQRLDVLAGEGDRDDDDGARAGRRQLVEQRLGGRTQPALASDFALEAEAGARAELH